MNVGYIRVHSTSIPIVEKPVRNNAARGSRNSPSGAPLRRTVGGPVGGRGSDDFVPRKETSAITAIDPFTTAAPSDVLRNPKVSMRTIEVSSTPTTAPRTFER